MTAEDRPRDCESPDLESRDPDPQDLLAWLSRQRLARDPSRLLLIRGVDGRVVAVLPRNGREDGTIDDEPEDRWD